MKTSYRCGRECDWWRCSPKLKISTFFFSLKFHLSASLVKWGKWRMNACREICKCDIGDKLLKHETDDTITGYRLSFDDKLSHWGTKVSLSTEVVMEETQKLFLYFQFSWEGMQSMCWKGSKPRELGKRKFVWCKWSGDG